MDKSIKLSKTQLEVLKLISEGKPFCEFITPDPRRRFFRSLGEYIPAKLNYVLGGKRVAYATFRVLFKSNLITPSRYKGEFSPQKGITQFYLTLRSVKLLSEE